MRRATLGIAGTLTIASLASAAISAPPAFAADKAKVTITVQTDRQTLDPEHPTATISGQVTAQKPGEDAKPLAGVKVDLTVPDQTNVDDPVTDADGKFAVVYTSSGNANAVHAQTAATDELEAAEAATPVIDVHKARTRVSVAADKPKHDYGNPFTLSGKVEWESSTGWRALAGSTVALQVPNNGCGSASQSVGAKTDDAGHYAVKVKPACDTLVYANVDQAGLYLGSSAEPLSLAVRAQTYFDSFSASMDAFGWFKASGHLSSRRVYIGYNGQVLLEYSYNGRDHWKTVKKLRLSDGSFSTAFRVNNSGHWRARFAGSPTGMPSTGPVRKLLRWGTRMGKISVSPRKVRKNRSVTVKGTLTRYYNLKQKKPTAFPSQSVRIIFRFKGKKTWYHLAWTKTDRKGRFSKKVHAYGDGYYAAVYEGSKTTWAVGSSNTPYVNTYGLDRPGSFGGLAGIQALLPSMHAVPLTTGDAATSAARN